MNISAKHAWWWSSLRSSGFGGAWCTPVSFSIILVMVLGVGSAFWGLMPGLSTQNVTLSGVGTPWIGLVILLSIASLWYWVELKNGYEPWMMSIIVVISIGLEIAITTWSLDVWVDEFTEPIIAGLGVAMLCGVIFGLMGLLFDNFLEGLVLGLMIGALIGLFHIMMVAIVPTLLVTLMCACVVGLATGTGTIIRQEVKLLLRQRQ